MAHPILFLNSDRFFLHSKGRSLFFVEGEEAIALEEV
jgi:hypothetical protein